MPNDGVVILTENLETISAVDRLYVSELVSTGKSEHFKKKKSCDRRLAVIIVMVMASKYD